MCSLALFLSVDPSLGRVDYRLFSDQTLMEMLLDGLADQTKKRYQDDEGMYLDVCEWSCIKCDDDKRVIRIERDSESLTGSIELRYVPPKVKRLVLSSIINGQLIGSVDLTHLPDGMQTLFLDNNQLTGEIDLANLPHGMNELSLKSNKLTGEVELTHLPAGMKGLYLQNNQLTGEIDLTNLPQGMKYLRGS